MQKVTECLILSERSYKTLGLPFSTEVITYSIYRSFWTLSRQFLDPSRNFLSGQQILDRFSIHQGWLLLDSSFTASRSVKTLLHALSFTCFASFYYLVIHSILFHYIHAFIWIPCALLIILDHLYVSRVKLYSFCTLCQL